MERKTDRTYPSASLEKNIGLEQRLEKKLKDVKSFKNPSKNIKEKITYFKQTNKKSKKKYKKYKTLTTILKSFDTFSTTSTTSSSISQDLDK